MKKIIILLTTILFGCEFSNAQIQKGSQTLGFNLDHARSTYNSVDRSSGNLTTYGYTNDNVGIGPGYSYFVANGLELGGSVSYSQQTVQIGSGYNGVYSDLTDKSYGFSVRTSLKKYILFANKFGFSYGPYLSYTQNKLTEPYNVNYNGAGSGNDHTYTAGGSLSLVYYPSSKLRIVAGLCGLSYSYTKSNMNDGHGKITESSYKNWGLYVINSGLSLGAVYVFGAK